MGARLWYLILWMLALIGYSVPWARADARVFIGWEFTIPFSITYLIALLIGLVVLITRSSPLVLTVLSGMLMLLGLAGAGFGLEIMVALAGLAGARASHEPGIGFAFLVSILYLVLGSYLARKLAKP